MGLGSSVNNGTPKAYGRGRGAQKIVIWGDFQGISGEEGSNNWKSGVTVFFDKP